MRCTSCGHAWFAKAPEEGEVADNAPETPGLTREQVERLRQTAAANSASRTGPHAEYRAREVARRKHNQKMAGYIGWGAGMVIFGGLLGGAVVMRDSVANAWPQTASLYKMVGLDVNRFGLDLTGVDAKRSFDGTTPVLTVWGEASNKGKERREAPMIRVELLDEHGKVVHSWTDGIGVPFLEPGQVVKFTTKTVSPPPETLDLAVTYVVPEGGAAKPAHPPAAAVKHGDIEPAPAGEHGDENHAAPEGGGHDAGGEHAPADSHAPAGGASGDAGHKPAEPEHH